MTPIYNNPQKTVNLFVDPIYARIAEIDKVVVSHSRLNTAIEGLKQCIAWSEVSREPRGALLTGVGGAGKTTICLTILSMFPARTITEEDRVIRIVPAFYASVPSPSTIKSLASSILQSLGDPEPMRGSASALTARLGRLLKTCQTKIILLDEFHNLLAEASAGEPRANKVCNWIRSLINDTGVMLCLVGMPACEALVDHDTQMARRFTHRFSLADLDPGTSEKPGELRGFLLTYSKKMVERLALTSFIDFHDHLRVSQVWAATGGRPAYIVILFKEAVAIALARNASHTSIVLEDLAEAYDKGLTLSVAKVSGNPFRMSRQMLASAVGAIKLR